MPNLRGVDLNLLVVLDALLRERHVMMHVPPPWLARLG